MPSIKHILVMALVTVATIYVVRKAGVAGTVGLDA
jgi:hypothetical protein